jgi:hypothetical protein
MTGLHHHEVAKYLSGLLEEGTVHIQRGKRGGASPVILPDHSRQT